MGMFDSLYADDGHEWQTKAYSCNLDEYRVGDRPDRDALPGPYPSTYQVEVLGSFGHYPDREYLNAFATVRDDVLVEVPAERDESLPLLNYSGHLVADGA